MKKKGNKKFKTGYLCCSVSFDHDLGETAVEVYPTKEEAEDAHPKDESNGGVVKVKIEIIKQRKNK